MSGEEGVAVRGGELERLERERYSGGRVVAVLDMACGRSEGRVSVGISQSRLAGLLGVCTCLNVCKT